MGEESRGCGVKGVGMDGGQGGVWGRQWVGGRV